MPQLTTLRRVTQALFAGAVLAIFATAADAAADNGVLRATLDNGLKVVIVRNNLAPVVSTSVNYLVGSDEAPTGFPGTAHALEHMMFRGSPGLTADQLANIGSVMGGNFNANTREALTQYLYTVPAEDLEVALHIEALRMADIDASESEWKNERGAIEQEVAQDLSNPGYILYSKLRKMAFAGTPYASDALGTRASFDKTPASMLHAFHQHWYAPNNAIIVIVGNVDPQATLIQVRALFGAIPRKVLPKRAAVHLQPIKADSFAVDTDRPTGTEMIAMRVPGLDSADMPALELLSDILSSERFDLYGLVPQGKALSAQFALDPLPQAGLAYATVSFPAGQDHKALEQQVRAILKKAATDGVPAELLEAAKMQERTQTEFMKNSISGLASVWADAVALYGLDSPEEDLARIEKVSLADVNRVARKYLDLDHAITAVMLPKGSGRPVATSGGFGGQESIALGEAKPTALPSWAQSAMAHLTVPTVSQPQVSKLSNGITLIVQPESVSDTVSVYGDIRTRSETETPTGQDGVSALLSQLLSFGTEHLDRLAYQQALDEIGADAHAGTEFSVQSLAGHFDRAVQLLADNELHPALPSQALEVLKPQLAQVVTARQKSPGYLVQRSLRVALFPATDPQLRETTAETVHSLTLEQVKAYHRATFRPDLTTIVVIGKVTPEQARATIEKYFGGWQAEGPAPNIDLPVVPANAPAVVAVPDASRVQDVVVLAQNLALTRSNPDYYALELGSNVLGGGFYSTRLTIHLRKEAGLVYSAGSTLQAGRTRGLYLIDLACDPQNVSKAAAMAVQEVRNMQDKPAGDEELLRVKSMLLRQIPLSNASTGGIAMNYLGNTDLNLPLDEDVVAAQHFIDLSPKDVQVAFKKWMRPTDFVRVTQGPEPQ